MNFTNSSLARARDFFERYSINEPKSANLKPAKKLAFNNRGEFGQYGFLFGVWNVKVKTVLVLQEFLNEPDLSNSSASIEQNEGCSFVTEACECFEFAFPVDERRTMIIIIWILIFEPQLTHKSMHTLQTFNSATWDLSSVCGCGDKQIWQQS